MSIDLKRGYDAGYIVGKDVLERTANPDNYNSTLGGPLI